MQQSLAIDPRSSRKVLTPKEILWYAIERTEEEMQELLRSHPGKTIEDLKDRDLVFNPRNGRYYTILDPASSPVHIIDGIKADYGNRVILLLAEGKYPSLSADSYNYVGRLEFKELLQIH